jgi:hypothetical protein
LDQVIVTRNVKFDESTFYEGDPEEEMPVEQATQIADALHDSELINAAEELDIPLPSQVLADQNPELTTDDQTLGGAPNDEVEQEDGLPDVQTEVPEDATRDDRQASDDQGIRVSQFEDFGLATPDVTPEPESLVEGDRSNRREADSYVGAHLPVRAGLLPSRDLGSLIPDRTVRLTRSRSRTTTPAD